jgi:hypothetical protein
MQHGGGCCFAVGSVKDEEAIKTAESLIDVSDLDAQFLAADLKGAARLGDCCVFWIPCSSFTRRQYAVEFSAEKTRAF